MTLTPCLAGLLIVTKGMVVLDVSDRAQLWMLLAKTLSRTTEALLVVPQQELKTQLKTYKELLGALLARRPPHCQAAHSWVPLRGCDAAPKPLQPSAAAANELSADWEAQRCLVDVSPQGVPSGLMPAAVHVLFSFHAPHFLCIHLQILIIAGAAASMDASALLPGTAFANV